MIFIGVDPGLTGALAFIDSATGAAAIEDIPTVALTGKGLVQRRIDGQALAQVVRRHMPADETCTVVCEAVHAMGGNSMQTMGSLLRSLGAIEAVFDVLRHPAAMVTPQTWQRLYGLAGKKAKREPGTVPEAIRIARELYPDAAQLLQRVKDHNRAEALLIAHYGLRSLA